MVAHDAGMRPTPTSTSIPTAPCGSPARRAASLILLLVVLLPLPLVGAARAAIVQDPGARGPHEVVVTRTTWTDDSRERSLPLRIARPRTPAAGTPMPVILFSHGLGGSREGGQAWGDHWASHGYLVVHLQHPGSDSSVWQGAADRAAMIQGLRKAMSPAQFMARVIDVRFVLDELARRVEARDPLLGPADLSRIGMSGHSFGAITTQAIAGQSYGPSARGLADARIKASIAFSPSAGRDSPLAGTGNRFGDIRQPFLSLTGTLDTTLASNETAASRQLPFEQMPGPDKYLLVLDGADHATFGGQPELRQARRTRQGGSDAGAAAAADDAIRAASLMFWNAHLLGDVGARDWLAGGAFEQRLRPSDRWRVKR